MNYVLDAGAMIAFLGDETGADRVEDFLTEPGSACYTHIVNLAELFYVYYRRGGPAAANQAIENLRGADVIFRDDNDAPFWMQAATFKGKHALALPDGYCLALAQRLDATVVTTDHNEFDPLLGAAYCSIVFIR